MISQILKMSWADVSNPLCFWTAILGKRHFKETEKKKKASKQDGDREQETLKTKKHLEDAVNGRTRHTRGKGGGGEEA